MNTTKIWASSAAKRPEAKYKPGAVPANCRSRRSRPTGSMNSMARWTGRHEDRPTLAKQGRKTQSRFRPILNTKMRTTRSASTGGLGDCLTPRPSIRIRDPLNSFPVARVRESTSRYLVSYQVCFLQSNCEQFCGCGTFVGVSPASLCTVLQCCPWTPPD